MWRCWRGGENAEEHCPETCGAEDICAFDICKEKGDECEGEDKTEDEWKGSFCYYEDMTCEDLAGKSKMFRHQACPKLRQCEKVYVSDDKYNWECETAKDACPCACEAS